MKPRWQGDIGELSAMQWLVWNGYKVWRPLGHSPDIDIVATRGDQVVRIEVKTATHFRNGRWEVMIATRGGNQSWSGVAKLFDRARCDYLFVLVGDGRRWFIPTDRLEAMHGIRLGGPKYAEFEVDPDRPIADWAAA